MNTVRSFGTLVAAVSAAAAASKNSSTSASCSGDSSARGIHDSLSPTPLLELRSLSRALGCRVVAKAEFMHPGGSVKDRAAHYLLASVERSGALKPGGTVVQPSGGNTGIR